jgi:PmbA protein
MNYQPLLDYSLKALTDAGADKGQVTLRASEKYELNTEANAVKLLRSTDEVNVTLLYIKDQKKASTSVNKATESAIDEAIVKLVDLAKSAPVDEANDISSDVENNTFNIGLSEPDLDAVYNALDALNEEMKTVYTKVKGDAILSYDYYHKYLANTNGVLLEETNGKYNLSMMFAAKDGDKITSFNYTGGSFNDINTKLTEVGLLGDLMDQTVEELEAKPFEGKFVGDVIITPTCFSDFLRFVEMSSLSDHSLIAGSSVLKDKIGESIAAPIFNWHSNPRSNELADAYAITRDGFVAEDLTIIKEGVLQTHLLSLYGANKTGGQRAKNYGGSYVVDPGTSTLEDMIKDVKQGILLARFSGGRPGADGGFAGVAKNSFYIEDGQIKYPMSETMISGNLYEILKNIKSISKDRVNYGSAILPWVHTTGTTISGK